MLLYNNTAVKVVLGPLVVGYVLYASLEAGNMLLLKRGRLREHGANLSYRAPRYLGINSAEVSSCGWLLLLTDARLQYFKE